MKIEIIDGCENKYGHETVALLKQHNEKLGHTTESKWYTVAAVEDNVLLGGATVLAQWDYIFIDQIYVKNKRDGVGRKLMTKIEELAKNLGKKGLYAFTGLFQAPEFYVKLGFRESGRIPAFVSGHDEILYVKLLSDEKSGEPA